MKTLTACFLFYFRYSCTLLLKHGLPPYATARPAILALFYCNDPTARRPTARSSSTISSIFCACWLVYLCKVFLLLTWWVVSRMWWWVQGPTRRPPSVRWRWSGRGSWSIAYQRWRPLLSSVRPFPTLLRPRHSSFTSLIFLALRFCCITIILYLIGSRTNSSKATYLNCENKEHEKAKTYSLVSPYIERFNLFCLLNLTK